MSVESIATPTRRIAIPGLGWAALGVFAFSFTFPATTLAERSFNAFIVGAGRSVLAGVLAAASLLVTRAPLPRRDQWRPLLAVAVGCGIGFGVLSALALRHTSSTHGAVVIALLPAATAVVAVTRAHGRPRWPFWAASAVATVAVLAYAVSQTTGGAHAADVLLLIALLLGAVGYAEGGRLAREMPGWRVIAWGVVLALPVSVPITAVALARAAPAHASPSAIGGLLYVGTISMFFGFFAWYRGLAQGGVVHASQIQLAQPMLTIFWSALLLGDAVGPGAVLTATVVSACILVTQTSRRPAAAAVPVSAPATAAAAAAAVGLPAGGPHTVAGRRAG